VTLCTRISNPPPQKKNPVVTRTRVPPTSPIPTVTRPARRGPRRGRCRRTGLIAQMSGAQSLGFVLGPGLGYFLADLLKNRQVADPTHPPHVVAGRGVVDAITFGIKATDEPPSAPPPPREGMDCKKQARCCKCDM
jgi:hypothetical protein